MERSNGIIKVTTPKGEIKYRFWVKNGMSRGAQPDGEYKWDFEAMDENEKPLCVQIQLTKLPEQV